jgi:hypothetical protein
MRRHIQRSCNTMVLLILSLQTLIAPIYVGAAVGVKPLWCTWGTRLPPGA